MRVWVLRGAGPTPSRALGYVDLVLNGADAAIDRLQERAFAMHADAVVHVQIEHVGDHAVRVHGVAVRFGG